MAYVQEVMKSTWKVHHFVEYYLRQSLRPGKTLGFDEKGHVYVVASSAEETVRETVEAYEKAVDALEEDRRYSFVLNGQYELLNEAIYEQRTNSIDMKEYFTEERLSSLMSSGGFMREEFPHLYSLLIRNALFMRILVDLKEQLSYMCLEKNVREVLRGVDDFVLSQEQSDAARRKKLKEFYESFLTSCRSRGWCVIRCAKEREVFWWAFFRENGFVLSSFEASDLEVTCRFTDAGEKSQSSKGKDVWGFQIFSSSVSYRNDSERAMRLMSGECL